MRQLHRISVCAIAVLFLGIMGCGGGGMNQSGTLALTATSTLNAGATGTSTATYTAATGQNPQGLVINFSTDRPDIVALSSSSQRVGTDGKTTITFTAVSVPVDTTVKIIAQTGGLSQFQQVVVKGTGGSAVPPSITINPQSIEFTKVQYSQISLKGYGTSLNPESSIVTFTVKGTDGNPLAGQTVNFTLNSTTGGITIVPSSGKSDSNGQVQTIVSSGTMATTVQVTAKVVIDATTTPPTTASANSTQLVVAGGPPDQDSFSIALSTFNVEAWDINGVTSTITASLADHFNNPVADGTAVYFTTNGGSIQNSCTTKNGSCSVVWTSSDPRPPAIYDSSIPPKVLVNAGSVVILARAVGEESFTDANNNNVADGATPCTPVMLPGVGLAQHCGEFYDTPDAFRDDNFNNVHDDGEPFYNLTGSTTYSGPDGLYEGSFLPSTNTTNARSKYIFYNSKLIMSGSTASIDLTPVTVPLNSTVPVTLTVTDINGNPMPAGTTITVASTADSTVRGLSFTPASLTVPNTSSTGVNSTTFNLSANNKWLSSTSTTENVLVTVTTPRGIVTTKSFIFSY